LTNKIRKIHPPRELSGELEQRGNDVRDHYFTKGRGGGRRKLDPNSQVNRQVEREEKTGHEKLLTSPSYSRGKGNPKD